MALPVGIAPTTRRFEAGRSDLLCYGSLLKWCAVAALPRPAAAGSVRRSASDLPARDAGRGDQISANASTFEAIRVNVTACRPVLELLAYSSMTIWKSLLLIYRRIDVRFTCGPLPEQHFLHTLSEEEVYDAVSSFRAFPALAKELSQGQVEVTYDIIFIEEPLCFLTADGKESHWVSPDDVRHEMDIHARAGQYDSIFVFWPQTNLATGDGISSRGWGFGLGPSGWTNGATYAVVANAPTWAWNIPIVGEVWLHEWLHGVCAMLAEAGFDMPEYDADGGGSHGYIQSETTGWTSYYRDLMTGQVLEGGTRKGITAAAWRSYKPLACVGTLGEMDGARARTRTG